MSPNAKYVGRPTKWGNPYRIMIEVNGVMQLDRATSIRRYDDWLKGRLAANPTFLDELKGKDLACFCPLDKACHADVLLKYLERAEDCDHDCKKCPSKAVCVASPFRGM